MNVQVLHGGHVIERYITVTVVRAIRVLVSS